MTVRWHREPLVHFLALGAGLFLLYGAVRTPEREDSVIELTAGDIEQLVRTFEGTFVRPPTATELEGLIEERIQEEVLYREALAMGLDRDDGAIRRRLRQKVEFVFNDIAGLVDPTEADLQAYLDDHEETYRHPSRVSFRQIYLNQDRRGDAALADAERLLAKLQEDPQIADAGDSGRLGDPLPLPNDYESVSETELVKLFGRDFPKGLEELPLGRWAGPVRSGYGLHLIRIRERVPGEVPAFEEVRKVVRRDWSAENRRKSARAFYEGLRKRYTVHVERPEASEEASVDVAEAQ